jgi:hypothetical protein
LVELSFGEDRGKIISDQLVIERGIQNIENLKAEKAIFEINN